MTSSELVLSALETLLSSQMSPATVLRNTDIPEKIPANGLVIVRDGNPGDPERVLGGFSSCYYSHIVDIEIFVQIGDQDDRDTAFNTLQNSLGSALESDPLLGGLVQNSTYGYASPSVESVPGAAGIKSGIVSVTLEYETATPIA